MGKKTLTVSAEICAQYSRFETYAYIVSLLSVLASCLSIVICVASRSSDARAFLRSFSLQVQSSDGIVGQDMTHMVLFTLASTAVPPEIRGLTFSALATIYQDCSPKDAIEGWGLVESTGFLPIYKLQQYPTQITENDVPSITFPTVQVSSHLRSRMFSVSHQANYFVFRRPDQ